VTLRPPEIVRLQAFPTTELHPTQVGSGAPAPGVAVRVTAVEPENVTEPTQVLPLLHVMAGVSVGPETVPARAPAEDRTVTVTFAVAPSAGEATKRPAASAPSRSLAPFMSPPWPSVRSPRCTRPEEGSGSIPQSKEDAVHGPGFVLSSPCYHVQFREDAPNKAWGK
jgi:hypothetical protein